MRRISIFLVLVIINVASINAQSNVKDADKDAAYAQAISGRAERIVASLSIADDAKALRVKNIIVDQYRALNNIQGQRDMQIKEAKLQSSETKEAINTKVKGYEDFANEQVEKLHSRYIQSLSKELTAQQVDKVKNGMTYDVTTITYNGYLSEIPTLTDKQKEQIMAWLVEAREHAMDAESSEKKHAWFGKYKGRINNYLSSQGYDLKKEGEEWEKRLKSPVAAKN